MFIGVVIGNVWATKKDDQLNGMKLMVVQRSEEHTSEPSHTQKSRMPSSA